MKKAPTGILGRISWRAKLIFVLLLAVIAAAAVVLAFGAGFGTSMVLSETNQKDKCSENGGTWNAEKKLCVKETVTPQATGEATWPFDTFSCGDGTKFTFKVLDGDKERFQVIGTAAVHELSLISDSGPLRYQDDEISVTPDGTEAQVTQRKTGTKTLCTMDDANISQE
jgi:hypothetical protein